MSLQPSRIPQHTSTDPPRTDNHNKDASQVNSALLALGAPTISSDDFSRLYQGPFAELLLFMSTQIKGRREVARDRHLIQHIRESHSILSARIPGIDPVRRLVTELSNVQRETIMLREQLKKRQADLEQAQSQIADLKQILQEKHRAALLLCVLEGRERVRISRFQELMKMMMSTLRNTPLETPSEIEHPDLVSSVNVIQRRKFSYTCEVITNLHAYHARLCRIRESEHEPSSLLTSRLRLRLSKKVQADQLEDVLERYCKTARIKAKRKMRYHDSVLSTLPSITKEDLSSKERTNELMRQDLQRLSDKVIALGFLCEHRIASISVFLEQTSQILRSSILEDTPNVKGYIDVLRLRLSASEKPQRRERRRSLIKEMGRTCKMRTLQEPDAVMDAVNGMLQRAKERSSYLATVNALHAPSQTPEEEALIAQYYEKVESVEKRAQASLTRKVEKAALGESLIEDINTLMKDTRTLVG